MNKHNLISVMMIFISIQIFVVYSTDIFNTYTERSFIDILYVGKAVHIVKTDHKAAGWTMAHELALRDDLQLHSSDFIFCAKKGDHLDSPSQIDVRDNFGQTPMWVACSACNYDNYLFLKNCGADLHQKDVQYRSLLHAAASGVSMKCLDIVKDLVKNGVDLHQKDVLGNTPIDDFKHENNVINYQTQFYLKNRKLVLSFLNDNHLL
ncbi:putative ankyrin repeat protein [Cotonvirus japonicus]|uniref:Ankyrin repeat protein n=1 Tax=Cotonvirus japonicus TaxID=2811091 RepID=A0ABM7NU68_9VIRU|nr:putative ankyrin repeat protein [Cotonvirus japonicus]BCS83730.1 putative ankyrin repeat protein [Cotonvirus japonicus]